MNDLFLKRFI